MAPGGCGPDVIAPTTVDGPERPHRAGGRHARRLVRDIGVTSRRAAAAATQRASAASQVGGCRGNRTPAAGTALDRPAKQRQRHRCCAGSGR